MRSRAIQFDNTELLDGCGDKNNAKGDFRAEI